MTVIEHEGLEIAAFKEREMGVVLKEFGDQWGDLYGEMAGTDFLE